MVIAPRIERGQPAQIAEEMAEMAWNWWLLILLIVAVLAWWFFFRRADDDTGSNQAGSQSADGTADASARTDPEQATLEPRTPRAARASGAGTSANLD